MEGKTVSQMCFLPLFCFKTTTAAATTTTTTAMKITTTATKKSESTLQQHLQMYQNRASQTDSTKYKNKTIKFKYIGKKSLINSCCNIGLNMCHTKLCMFLIG
jgi:hypothetical protein